ncbi:MAG: ABC transporter permease [Methylobacteriaceae bacterium]|nr:ABC transporter permease [Methylobacteriaceae bacterium]MBV9637908.1 ABC transporter permease [Methylobacteriaceae bacterium]
MEGVTSQGTGAVTEPGATRSVGRSSLVSMLARVFAVQELGVLAAGLVIGSVFAFLSPEFLTMASAGSILASAVQFGIVGVGVTVLMIAGEFDLSVASVYSLCPLVMAWLWIDHGVNVFLSLTLALALAASIGAINGLATLLLNIPSFIITLATGLFWAGVSLNLTGGYPISYFGTSPVMSWLGAAEMGSSKISVSIFWLVAIVVILASVLRMTATGNWVFACGGDGRAARAMGVPVAVVKLGCFILSSVLAAFTGIVQFGSFGSATPTQGSDLALTALVVAVVGGGSLMGGRGSIVGALLAAIVLGMSYTGLVLSGVSTTWFQSFVGFLLLFAVIMNLRMERLGARFGVIRKS